MSIDPQSKTTSVEDELADVLLMICAVANRLDVNLENAFRQKEKINKKRKWTKES
jgi:NTP pyrophosphatase (non-canonical NTP hydrolase)